jgi:hypothetical protein
MNITAHLCPFFVVRSDTDTEMDDEHHSTSMSIPFFPCDLGWVRNSIVSFKIQEPLTLEQASFREPDGVCQCFSICVHLYPRYLLSRAEEKNLLFGSASRLHGSNYPSTRGTG